MKFPLLFVYLIMAILPKECNTSDPNVNQQGEDQLKSHEIEYPIDETNAAYKDIFYVPIYSEIYVDETNQQELLSATLSIRNTSFKDSLIVSRIDYYNTEGSLVRKFLNKPISLSPMGTIKYIIEKDDVSGGSGANFIVALSANSVNVKPLIQAIMINYSGNKGLAFCTDGYSIK